MDVERFRSILEPILTVVGERALDDVLERELNADFPAGGEVFEQVEQACREAIEAGWMCAQGGPGRRFGRVVEPGPSTRGLSVDVVDLDDIVGPHHRHPTGEICMIMPLSEGAEFDGRARGWCVYEPGSDHHPTVTGGEALVLYMLPGGEIEYTGR